MKKNLEDKILEKVYNYETKTTAISLSVKLTTIIVFSIILYLFGSVFWEYASSQETVGLFEVFNEDWEVGQRNIYNIATIIYNESPKEVLVITLLSLGLICFLILTLAQNFERIRKKITSIIRHYRL